MAAQVGDCGRTEVGVEVEKRVDALEPPSHLAPHFRTSLPLREVKYQLNHHVTRSVTQTEMAPSRMRIAVRRSECRRVYRRTQKVYLIPKMQFQGRPGASHHPSWRHL